VLSHARSTQEQASQQLKALSASLQALFLSQKVVEESLHLPVPVCIRGSVTPVTFNQADGLVHAQMGRMMGVMAEPYDQPRWWPSRRSIRASRTFKWRVGDGDTVPTALPPGAFVLNRRASQAIKGDRRHFQIGGTMTGGGVTFHQTINFNNVQIRNDQDIKKLVYEIRRENERMIEAKFRKAL
jgi:hypothetical protein